jgi:hypothetical protein
MKTDAIRVFRLTNPQITELSFYTSETRRGYYHISRHWYKLWEVVKASLQRHTSLENLWLYQNKLLDRRASRETKQQQKLDDEAKTQRRKQRVLRRALKPYGIKRSEFESVYLSRTFVQQYIRNNLVDNLEQTVNRIRHIKHCKRT